MWASSGVGEQHMVFIGYAVESKPGRRCSKVDKKIDFLYESEYYYPIGIGPFWTTFV